MSRSTPNQIHKNNMTSSYNEGNSNLFAFGFDSQLIQQPITNYQESFPSPKNELTNLNRQSKLFTRTETIKDVNLVGKNKQIESIKRQITIQKQRRDSQLLRQECVVKDEKTALKFSTLYVSKFIRRIKAVSSIMRFKEMRQSQFKIIEDPSSDYNYYFIKGAFEAEAPSLFDKICHTFKSKLINYQLIQYTYLFLPNSQIIDSHLWKALQSKYCILFSIDQSKILILPVNILIWTLIIIIINTLILIFFIISIIQINAINKKIKIKQQFNQNKKLIYIRLKPYTIYNNCEIIQVGLFISLLIIQQNSLTRLLWTTFLFFIILINIIYIPLKYSFELQEYHNLKGFVFHLPIFAFTAEIVITFFTAIYRKGLIITTKKIIFQNYVKGRLMQNLLIIVQNNIFMFDYYRKDIIFLALFAIGLQTNYFTDLIIVVRTFDLFSILREIDERFQFRGKVANLMELFKLIFFIIIFAHFIACSWHKIGILGEERGELVTWMTSFKSDNIPDSSYDYYVTSLYWAVVTMITLGYGDIVPKNLVSCILFAYSMNSIGEILKEMGRKKLIFLQQMGLIDTYMRKRGLNQLTQMKVRKYFEYLNKESMEDNEQSSQLIQNLPQTLKEEVYSDVYGRVLNQKKIFQLHFSPEFLKDLSLQIRERRLGPEEVLIKEDQVSDSVYIVMKGKVQMKQRNHHVLKHFVKGDLFGELSFFGDQQSEYTAVTSNVTSLAVLNKKDFLDVILRFPKDYEQYCFMKDSINLCSNIEGLDHQCVGCGNYTHTIKTCQFVNYVRNKQKVLNLYTKIYEQKRKKHKRKPIRKGQNTLMRQKQVYDSVVKSIFLASKFAKEQDLYEELSDMDSDINDSLSNENPDQDQDDDLSHAAISMISSISPQFTQDFFQRTKFKKKTKKEQNIQQVKKISQFARYTKDDDFGMSRQDSFSRDKFGSINSQESISRDKFGSNKLIFDSKQGNVILDKIKIEPKIKKIIPQTNKDKQSSIIDLYQETAANQIEDDCKENSSINCFEQKSFQENILKSQESNNKINQNMFKSQNNGLLSPIKQNTSPKNGFFNLQRPRDLKLDLLKANQNNYYLEGSSENIEDKTEQQKISSIKKGNSIILYYPEKNYDTIQNNDDVVLSSQTLFNQNDIQKQELSQNIIQSQQKVQVQNEVQNNNINSKQLENRDQISNQSSISNHSELNIQNERKKNKNKYLNSKKGQQALLSFANDFGKASFMHFKNTNKATSLKMIEHIPQFGKNIKSSKQLGFDDIQSYDRMKSQELIPKIPILDQKENTIESIQRYSKSQNKLQSYQSIEIGKRNYIRQQTDKEFGGYLSPIAHAGELSPFNFMQTLESSNQVLLSNFSQQSNSKSHQRLTQAKSFLNNMRFNQINEEIAEQSQLISSEDRKSKSKKVFEEDISKPENEVQVHIRQQQRQLTYKQQQIDEQTDQLKQDLNSEQNRLSIIQYGNSDPYILNFERIKDFEYYFPDDNYEKIILKYNRYRRKTEGYKTMISKKKIVVRKKLAIFNKLHL